MSECLHILSILIILSLGIDIRGQHIDTADKSDPNVDLTIEQINNQIRDAERETEQLNSINNKMLIEIDDLKSECEEQILVLNIRYEEIVNVTEEKLTVLDSLLRNIHKEEEENSKLEAELNELTEAIEVYEYQLATLQDNVKLSEKRRSSGTFAKCQQVLNALDLDGENLMATRSFTRHEYKKRHSKTNNDIQVILLKNKLNVQEILKAEAEESVNIAKRMKENEITNCDKEKAYFFNLLEEAARARDTSKNSMTQLQKNLEVAEAYSNSLRLNIETGNSILSKLQERINDLKNKFEDFKEDISCFKKIQSMD